METAHQAQTVPSSDAPTSNGDVEDAAPLAASAASEARPSTILEDENATATPGRPPAAPAADPVAPSRARSFWKNNGRGLIAFVVAFVVGALAVGATGSFPSQRKKDEPARAESGGIVKVEEETARPSDSPSGMPSTVPSVSPQWNVEYLSLTTDFGSADDLVMRYAIGINRAYETRIYARDCETPVTADLLRLTAEREPRDDYSDALTLNYSVDLMRMRSSNVWNDATSQINLCQVVSLVLPVGDDAPMFVIVEDKRTLDIDFNLSSEFRVGFEVQLSPGNETESP